MDPTLDGCDRKLRWAKKHLHVFEDEIARAESLNAHRITVELEANAREYVFKVVGLQAGDPDWALIAGDCIYNLRSVLDHLVYQLAVLGQGRGLTNKEAGSVGFPLAPKPEQFPKGRIELLRTGEQTRIRELQPYHAWDASIWGVTGLPPTEGTPDGRWFAAELPRLLERLVALDNANKHRFVNATWRTATWWEAPEPPIPLAFRSGDVGPLKDNAEVGRWHCDGPCPELPSDMDVNRYFPIGVALGDPFTMSSATDLLKNFARAVEIVLEIFRPCVEGSNPPLPLTAVRF